MTYFVQHSNIDKCIEKYAKIKKAVVCSSHRCIEKDKRENMDLESYLIEQKSHILAISRISQIIDHSLSENYYEILRGRIDKTFLDNIRALNNAIQLVSFGMRCFREETYKEIEHDYEDNFTFSSVVLEDL